jgi:hypothetical protein
VKCLTNSSQTPILEQLALMQLSPSENEPEVTTLKRALNHLERVDPDLSVAIRVASVEVRWSVIVEKHRDHDPKETADRRHTKILPGAAVGIRLDVERTNGTTS